MKPIEVVKYVNDGDTKGFWWHFWWKWVTLGTSILIGLNLLILSDVLALVSFVLVLLVCLSRIAFMDISLYGSYNGRREAMAKLLIKKYFR